MNYTQLRAIPIFKSQAIYLKFTLLQLSRRAMFIVIYCLKTFLSYEKLFLMPMIQGCQRITGTLMKSFLLWGLSLTTIIP